MKENKVENEETKQLEEEELDKVAGGFGRPYKCTAYSDGRHRYNIVVNVSTNRCKCGATARWDG